MVVWEVGHLSCLICKIMVYFGFYLIFILNPSQNVLTGILVQAKVLLVTRTKYAQMNASLERTANSLVSKAAAITVLKVLGLCSTL